MMLTLLGLYKETPLVFFFCFPIFSRRLHLLLFGVLDHLCVKLRMSHLNLSTCQTYICLVCSAEDIVFSIQSIFRVIIT